MKKNRVLHLLTSNSYSGAENVVCTIIENDKDYDMYYCCPKGPVEEILIQRNIKYIPIKKITPYSVKKICKKNNIDILHAHDYKASFLAGLSGFDGKIISHLHGNVDFIKTWNIYTLLYNLVIKKFSKIIVVSDDILRDAVYAKKNKDKFVVIRNVVDKKRVIDQSLKFNTKPYDIIYLGRLCDVKNPLLVVEIINLVKKDFPDIKVCMIGTGDMELEVKSMIYKYNLSENIELLGFKSNPFPYIKNSKLSLLTSKHEGLPMSAIECMILGVPVINSGVDGLEILFKNHKEFICKTPEEYYNIISKILRGKNSYSKECKDIIKDVVNMKLYIKNINKTYE